MIIGDFAVINYYTMKARFICTLILISFFLSSQGQNFKKQQDAIFAYNIVTSGLISGIGGAIHKKKNEKTLKAFFKNFGKGCLGGMVKYTAKSQTFYLKDPNNIFFAPFNRAMFFMGHSISMNASMNQASFENLYFNYLGFNFKYQRKEEKGHRFSSRLSAGTLASTLSFFYLGHEFNLYKSLEYGVFYFDLDPTTTIDGLLIDGLAGYNSMAIKRYNNPLREQQVVPHELVHIYQSYDYFGLSSFYYNKEKALLNKSKLYRFTSQYIDFDYEPIFQGFLYQVQPKPRYYRNFFEFEAEHFSSRQAIER